MYSITYGLQITAKYCTLSTRELLQPSPLNPARATGGEIAEKSLYMCERKRRGEREGEREKGREGEMSTAYHTHVHVHVRTLYMHVLSTKLAPFSGHI